jgi:hypothetical protein
MDYNMDMGSLLGKMEVNIEETIEEDLRMAMGNILMLITIVFAVEYGAKEYCKATENMLSLEAQKTKFYGNRAKFQL